MVGDIIFRACLLINESQLNDNICPDTHQQQHFPGSLRVRKTAGQRQETVSKKNLNFSETETEFSINKENPLLKTCTLSETQYCTS